MKKIDLTTGKPTTMTVFANAVWNEVKEVWEVSVEQMGTSVCARNGEAMYFQNSAKYEIITCDEFVIPAAILQDNGIDTNKLFVKKLY